MYICIYSHYCAHVCITLSYVSVSVCITLSFCCFFILSTTTDDTSAQRSARVVYDPDALSPRRFSQTWSSGWGRRWLATVEEEAQLHWPTQQPYCGESLRPVACWWAAADPHRSHQAPTSRWLASMLNWRRKWSRALSPKYLYPISAMSSSTHDEVYYITSKKSCPIRLTKQRAQLPQR